MNQKILLLIGAAVCSFSTLVATAFAQGTAFTYQGRLNDGANPANGTYDLQFAIYNAIGVGTQEGNLITNSATVVSNGLFTVTLDFGNQFPGAARWLEIGVRTNGGGSFFTLSPRQALTPAPYAITAGNVISGGLASGTYGNAVTLNNAGNQFNGTFTGNGGGLTNLSAVTLGGLSSSNFWQLGGNSVAPGQFLGSTNSQPVEVRVNNQRVLQLSSASNSASGYSPNILGGFAGNFVSNGVVGATIVGGGSAGASYSPSTNQVMADFGTVVGGYGNIASGPYSVAMGFRSGASGEASTALGAGQAAGNFSTAMGNSGASGNYSTAMGSSGAGAAGATAMGESTASGANSTAMGSSTASGASSTAMGFSFATADYATALGQSTATGTNSAAMGNSTASGEGATAIGELSTASRAFCTAMGQSMATNRWATAMGNSTAGGEYSAAIGSSTATSDFSTAMGISSASGISSTAMGESTARGFASTAMGVASAIGDYSTAMGYSSAATNLASFAAGSQAHANHQGAFVWADSQISVFNSTGNDQFCIRSQGGVQLDNSTSMYFGNQTRQMLNLNGLGYGIGVQNYTTYFRSYSDFSWFRGGVHSDTQNDPGAGGIEQMRLNSAGNLIVHLDVYAQAFNLTSDRNVKTGFHSVEPKAILDKVAELPISCWHYTNDVATPHIGPMAQDFYATFKVGSDDRHISTVDEGGVALAAIQGLNQKVEEQLKAKDAEIEQLNQSVAELKAMVSQLAQNKAK